MPSPRRKPGRRAFEGVVPGPLNDLPGDQRNCIVLFDVEGYDYAEIASIMRVEWGP